MQRRVAAAEHALKKAELRVRGAELRAESAEAELSHLRKHHAVGSSSMLFSAILEVMVNTARKLRLCASQSSWHQNGTSIIPATQLVSILALSILCKPYHCM